MRNVVWFFVTALVITLVVLGVLMFLDAYVWSQHA